MRRCHDRESIMTMTKSFRRSCARRLLDTAMRRLIALGVAPAHMYLLTATGRRTGRPRSTPVTLVERGADRWLVAPYGDVGWVKNVRACNDVRLTRGRRSEALRASEIPATESGAILQTYLANVKIVRPYFTSTPDSPVESFEAEASRHPVFRLEVPE
jgi:deazaflavin-dependent oxidoreductase (nitroreductase family)